MALALFTAGSACSGAGAPRPSVAPPPIPAALLGGRSTLPPACEPAGVVRDTSVEPSLAADPANPRHLVAAWQQDRDVRGGAADVVVAATWDGGRSWTQQPVPGLTRCSGGAARLASDPWVSIGAGGLVYLSALALFADHTGVVVSASPDGGRTWNAPLPLVADPRLGADYDKEAVTADPRARGRAYVVWVAFPPKSTDGANVVLLSQTADAGATWSSGRLIRNSHADDQFNQVLIVPGALLDVFAEAPVTGGSGAGLLLMGAERSADGGRTWTAGAAATVPDSRAALPGGGKLRAYGQDMSAAAGAGGVYLTYAENEPHGWAAIWVVRSPDGGRTWLAPVHAETGSAGFFLPTIAVASGGGLGLEWFAFPTIARGLAADLWFATSGDDGRTWKAARIAATNLSGAPQSNDGAFVGDYQGLASTGGRFELLSPLAGMDGPVALSYRVRG